MGKLLWEKLTYKEKNLNSISTLPSRTSLDYGFIQQDAGRDKCVEEGRETKNSVVCGLYAFPLRVGLTCELLTEGKPM